mmetsp:Transcript_26393/g.39003  ORF Transcript_26393/g.39003 Transcript_26393/m.39003 type:complete len:205 (+) Transcript_26393:50-664(+)|eukprot:CAMPEP_0194211644 /NCGR_PEP_ID=MMETSP0156-20130528/10792_1 /TAXON_ID=33649 /ORGANISM="Thalassionema nitzschioides, Strain L26-B" /LENGTH=204 /DNA_ID=CAMNT_0038939263 /DNA_START=51 /DNA_END=668 /DNA_ORIENTATION=-
MTLLAAIRATILIWISSLDVWAFQAPGAQATNRRKSSFSLGPVARNGLSYDDMVLGDGRRILPGDTVYCYYVGSYQKAGLFGSKSNEIFDKTNDGEPFYFQVGTGNVIPGWDLAICGFEDEIPPMNVGGVRKLKIPAKLAYGAEGAGPIPPNTDLDFELEILSANKESVITLQNRLTGYAGVFGAVAFLLFIGFNVLSGNWGIL